MRPHPRGAEVNPYDPKCWATCDRCGLIFNHYKLSWNFEWAGTRLVNQRVLVCQTCLDSPNRQLGTVLLPPDPMPVMNARPEQYAMDEQPVSVRVTMGGATRILSGTDQGQGAAWVIERIVSVPGDLP